MRMVLLASYFLVVLADAEATPQIFGDGKVTGNKAPFAHDFEVTPVTQSQFGHGVNFREATRNGAPILNSGNRNFFTAGTVAPSTTVKPLVLDDFNIDYYDYYYDHVDSEPGIIEQDNPLQPLNTCDTGCYCTNRGGLCIPADQACANPYIGGDCKPKPSNKACKCCLTPTVYKQDIENTVAFFLTILARHNITAGHQWIDKILNQTEQKKMSNIIETFAQHLPLKPSIVRFLNCLSGILQASNGIITGKQLEQHYRTRCIKSGQELPQVRKWIGCKNYKPNRVVGDQSFRSYPCGVWTTFHTITVKLTQGPQPQQPILRTLHDMVKYFPWCLMCQHDFLSMYKTLDGGAEGKTGDEAVMWLWKGHNNVTARTARSPSNMTNCLGTLEGTDQGRSQWQFPGYFQCPPCQSSLFPSSPDCRYIQHHRLDKCFDQKAVYTYLQAMYSTFY